VKYHDLIALVENNQRLTHSMLVSEYLGELMSKLNEVEVNQRSFLLAGNQSSLESYNALKSRIMLTVGQLNGQTQGVTVHRFFPEAEDAGAAADGLFS